MTNSPSPPATINRIASLPNGESGRENRSAQLVRLAKNATANLLRLGAGWIILLVVPPMLVHLLDRSEYATWMLMLQIGAYATFFDGGVQLAVAHYVARSRQQAYQYEIGQVLSSAIALLILPALMLCVLTVIVAAQLGHLFSSIPRTILPEAKTALLLIGLSLGFTFPTSALAGFSLGLEKFHINAVVGATSKLAGAAGVLWAAFHQQGLVRMAEWAAVGNLLQPLLFLLFTRRHRVFALLHLRFLTLRFIREFALFCSATMASQFSGLLISGLDLPIVAAWDFPNAGYYALGALISNLLVLPHGAVLSTIVPMMSKMTVGEPAERMGRILVRITRAATALLMIIAVPLMVGMPTLLPLWVGADYTRHTLLFGELLVAAQAVRLTLMPYTLIGFSAGEQQRMLASPLVEGIVNLIASLVLVRFMGAAGVALGTLIGAVVGVVLHFLVSMKRTRGITFRKLDLLWQGILGPIGWTLPLAGLSAAGMFLISSMVGRLLLLAASLVTLCALLWKSQLTQEEKLAVCGVGARIFSPHLVSKTIGA